MNDLIVNQVRSATLNLSPGETVRIRGKGSHIRISNSTSETALLVSADSSVNWPMQAGNSVPTVSVDAAGNIKPRIFDYVEFTNPTSGETIEFTFAISLGEMRDDAAVIRGSVQIDPSGPAISTPAAISVGTSAASVLQADVRIKERIIQNNGDYPLWYGDENVDPATKRGTCIYPQGAAVVNIWGAVYLMAETGATTASINNIQKVS